MLLLVGGKGGGVSKNYFPKRKREIQKKYNLEGLQKKKKKG